MKNGSYRDYINGETAGKTFTFIQTNGKYDPRVVTIKDGDGRPQSFANSFSIEASSTILMEWGSPKKLAPRKIRYIQGYQTIFVDEQKDVPTSFKPYMLEFKHGIFSVDGNNFPLLDFVMSMDGNETNGKRDKNKQVLFKLIDTKVVAETAADLQKSLAEANQFVWSGKWDDVCTMATIKGIKIADMDSNEVRFNLSRHIDPKNPQKFLNEMKHPDNVKKYLAMEGISRGFLALDKGNRSIAWATDISQPIITAPLHIDPIDYFVSVLKTEQGEKILSHLAHLIMPKKVEVADIPLPRVDDIRAAASVATEQVKPKVEIVDSMEDIETLLSEYIGDPLLQDKSKPLYFNKPFWYTFEGKSYKKKELVNKLCTDATFNKYFRETLAKEAV